MPFEHHTLCFKIDKEVNTLSKGALGELLSQTSRGHQRLEQSSYSCHDSTNPRITSRSL